MRSFFLDPDLGVHRITGGQGLLSRITGIQQCCAHVIRRCRAVVWPGPGNLQSRAGDVIEVLREAHQAAGETRAHGDTASGAVRSRLRDRASGSHPGCTPIERPWLPPLPAAA